jgi:hypothetical protein
MTIQTVLFTTLQRRELNMKFNIKFHIHLWRRRRRRKEETFKLLSEKYFQNDSTCTECNKWKKFQLLYSNEKLTVLIARKIPLHFK